ncbi:TetR/AcrR family transcriptional regulator, partial [Enterococcus faecium]|uniref:TetR/AcrR family transcriptional regulator n=1 Tax=Enterococcus faecium TaxID=1352 RepID=UPI00215A395B
MTNRHFPAKMNDIQSFKVGDDMSKREKIMLAAIDAFKEKGIEKTTISDIVKAAGVAQGTFYLYFPSKLSVMPAIAEHLIAQMVPAIEKEFTQHA